MSSELKVGIQFGADTTKAITGINSIRNTFNSLGDVAGKLKTRHTELGAAIQRNIGTLAPQSIAALNREYDRLGRTIDQLSNKQIKLAQLQIHGEALRQERSKLRGEILETIGLGLTVAAPVKLAISFESAMADVKKVVDFEEPQGFQKLGETIKEMSRTLPLTTGQLAQIAASGGQLGIKENDLPAFTETIAKMATAFDMSADQAGDSMAKIANVYNIPIKQIGRLGDAINQLSNESPAKASDIVNSLGRIGGVAKQFGLTEIQAASLSNAFISLGKSPEVAGTAINALLVKLQTADKQGSKFQNSLRAMGLNASMLKQSIEQDAQGALTTFLSKLGEIPKSQRMGILVDLFGLEYADDVAVLAGSLQTYLDSIEAVQKRNPNGKLAYEGSMEREFMARAGTTGNNLVLLRNSLTELGINIGAAVLPGLNALVDQLKPIIWGFTTWAKENPGVVAGVIKLAGGLAALKLTSLAARYGFSLFSSGINSLLTGFHLLHGKGLLLKTLFTTGFRITTLLQVFGMGADAATKWGTRLITLGGFIIKTGRLVGQALLWVGRAALANPIGLTLTLIAGAAYLVYRYWEPIKGFFQNLWGSLKTFFQSGIGNISQQIINWSPLGLFYRAFAEVMSWFDIDLPKTFTELGGRIIEGLTSGILAKFESVKTAIGDLAESIKNQFSGLLDIHSPSRVFIGYGDNIAEGAAIGISRSTPQAQKAAGDMAHSLLENTPSVPTGIANQPHHYNQPAAASTINVYLQQTFTLPDGNIKSQLQEAGKLTLNQLKQMLQKIEREKARVIY